MGSSFNFHAAAVLRRPRQHDRHRRLRPHPRLLARDRPGTRGASRLLAFVSQLPLPRRRPARRVPQDRRRCVRRTLGGGHAEQCGSGGVRDRPERLITPSATRPQHRRECAGSEHVLPSGSVFPLCVYGVASVRPPTARTCTRARMLRQYTCLCVCIASFPFACVPVFVYGLVRQALAGLSPPWRGLCVYYEYQVVCDKEDGLQPYICINHT